MHRELDSSYLPSRRLVGLIEEFKGRSEELEGISTSDAWEAVNRATKKLWGRSVLEELEADYEFESQYVKRFQDADYKVTDSTLECLQDLHELRGDLIKWFRGDPLSFVDLSAFVTRVLPRASPLPIIAKPSGGPGEPPNGWKRVLGYREPTPAPEEAESSWWWAITPTADPDGDIRLKAREHWLTLTSEVTPLAKLLMNGFSHRTMLGPELWFGRARLSQLGISVAVDPMFQFPADSSDATFFWHQTKRIEAVCDLCRAAVPRMSGRVLSPWILRRTEASARFAMERLGEGEVGKRRFWRDWSAWLICDDCEDAYVDRR